MANYYETLKVASNASASEIKSAYRRLARELHPDKNNGARDAAIAFAAIAEAYEVLRKPKDRAAYDRRLAAASLNGNAADDSLFASENSHARRWRRMVYEHRYNEIIDRLVAEERRESIALQKIIFPTVGLFVSTIAVGVFKPQIFGNAPVVGKILLIALFVAGLIHLFDRFRDAFARYTYSDDIHESLLERQDGAAKPYSRAMASGMLLFGLISSFVLGLLIGRYVDFISITSPTMFASGIKLEFIFYPPIFVWLVDIIHSFASRVE